MKMSSQTSAAPPTPESLVKTFQIFQPELGALIKRVQAIELDVERRERQLQQEKDSVVQLKAATLQDLESKKLQFEEDMKLEKQKLKEATEQHDHKVQWDLEALRGQRENFEEAQNRAIRMADLQEPVTVEVGGEKFRTELHTLAKCQGSVFPKLVESLSRRREEERSRRDPYIFIDRDGKHFRFILNYLRQGKQVMKCSAMKNPDLFTLNEILYDVQFYKIRGLELLIRRKAVSLGNKIKFDDLIRGKYFKEDTDKHMYVTTKGFELDNLNLTGILFEKVMFNHPITFKNCILSSAKFAQCNFKSVVNLTNVDLYKARFEHCTGLDFSLQTFETDISEATIVSL